MNFKIGDIVRRKMDAGTHCDLRPGGIGTVVDVNGKWVRVLPSTGGRGGEHNSRYLELVEIPDTITVEQALAFLKSKGEVQFTPKWERLQVSLNNSHLAYVYEHHVEEGCQKFTFDRVEALYAAVQKARYHGK